MSQDRDQQTAEQLAPDHETFWEENGWYTCPERCNCGRAEHVNTIAAALRQARAEGPCEARRTCLKCQGHGAVIVHKREKNPLYDTHTIVHCAACGGIGKEVTPASE